MADLNFKSDNEAPAHPDVLAAIHEANNGFATAYAEDAQSLALDKAFSDYFETDVWTMPVATGTAANSIILSELSPPWGSIFCHPDAHINNDEGGAPEFYTHGAKLILIEGDQGQINPDDFARALEHSGAHGVHNAKPSVLSITQATECGTSYRPEHIRALSDIAHAHGLSVHMDGARFCNAVAHLDVHPAEMTWRAGVDALAFGGTKNGALTAEAIVVFKHEQWQEGMARRRKRGGHLLSKMRYVSAQLLALLQNDLGHRLAIEANQKASHLATGLLATGRVQLQWPVEANEVFIHAHPDVLTHLKDQGAQFHIWPGYEQVARLVCSYATPDEHIDQLIGHLEAMK